MILLLDQLRGLDIRVERFVCAFDYNMTIMTTFGKVNYEAIWAFLYFHSTNTIIFND
jgi:hypothetical protein